MVRRVSVVMNMSARGWSALSDPMDWMLWCVRTYLYVDREAVSLGCCVGSTGLSTAWNTSSSTGSSHPVSSVTASLSGISLVSSSIV